MPGPVLERPEQLRDLLGIPFTREQLACVTAPPAPQAIVAGAGSGKTTVMAARVVWLTGTGQVAPERVLGLTFTNKAAGELAERVRAALALAGIGGVRDEAPRGAGDPPGDEPPGEPQISTYHAFAGRLITEHGLRLGIEPAARLLADAGRFQLAAEVLRTAPADFDPPNAGFTALVTDLVALDAELSEHLVTPGALRAFDTALLAELDGAHLSNAELRRVPEAAAGRAALLTLVEEYRRRKRARDLLDFGDQIALAATLARDVPEVGRALREQFGVVLLDEYQDTSVAQRVLLAGLFGDGTGHPVTAVGDPCQAIYGWRGASVANLDDFPEHFPHRDGTPAARFSLSENRRSGGRLLTLANDLAAPLRERHPAVVPLRPADGAERAGRVRCALLRTHAEELTWLADSVAHLVRTGTPPGEVAVLCRTATDFAAIQRELVARDVPVEVVGLSGLLHLPEVADLVAVLEVLADPTANAPLVRVLTGPRWRIGPRDLALLGRRARLLVRRGPLPGDADAAADGRLAAAVEGTDPSEITSLADALDTFVEGGPAQEGAEGDGLPFSAEARVRFAHLAAEIRELRRSLGDPLMDILHRVLGVTGLEVELAASPQALAARRRETLGSFLDLAAAFAAGRTGTAVDGEATLPAFLGFLRAAAQYDKGLDGSLPGGENTVKVLTAHKAKGLEWDVVAIPGLVAEGFPAKASRDSWLRQPRALPHPLRGDAATLPPAPSGRPPPTRSTSPPSRSTWRWRSCASATSPSPGRGRCSSARATGGGRARRSRAARRTSSKRCADTARPGPTTARSRCGPIRPPRTRTTRPWPTPTGTRSGRCRSTRWPSPAAARPPPPCSPGCATARCPLSAPGPTAAVTSRRTRDRPRTRTTASPRRSAAPSPRGTATCPRSPASCARPAPSRVTSPCPSRCRPPRCSASPPTRRVSPANWPAPCPVRRSPPPGAARGSTPGSSRGSRSWPCPCSARTSCRATTRRTTRRSVTSGSSPP